jgi:hypothetical protein
VVKPPLKNLPPRAYTVLQVLRIYKKFFLILPEICAELFMKVAASPKTRPAVSACRRQGMAILG